MITQEEIFQLLKTVIDPELHINIVDLGLIYEVVITEVEQAPFVKITMTLTTPGCPMAGTIQKMIKDSLFPIKKLNVDRNVEVEVTFDPPWSIECMSEEARAELGF